MGLVGVLQPDRFFRCTGFAVALCQSLLLVSCVAIPVGCSAPPATPLRGETNDIAPVSHSVDFGVLGADESKSIRIWISNSQQQEIRIVRWDYSCHCVSVTPAQLIIGPGERSLVDIEYAPDADGANEFVGRLHLRCTGLDEAGHEVARIEASVEVIRQDLPDSSK